MSLTVLQFTTDRMFIKWMHCPFGTFKDKLSSFVSPGTPLPCCRSCGLFGRSTQSLRQAEGKWIRCSDSIRMRIPHPHWASERANKQQHAPLSFSSVHCAELRFDPHCDPEGVFSTSRGAAQTDRRMTARLSREEFWRHSVWPALAVCWCHTLIALRIATWIHRWAILERTWQKLIEDLQWEHVDLFALQTHNACCDIIAFLYMLLWI